MAQDFEWKNSYSVGHTVLDQQHQQILAICKRANDCATGKRVDGDFHSIINDLVEFSRMHYAYEESVLRVCAFHLLDEHVAEHREDMARILDFIHNSLSGTVNKVSLADYALAWWKNHVLISDMQYRSVVLAKGSD